MAKLDQSEEETLLGDYFCKGEIFPHVEVVVAELAKRTYASAVEQREQVYRALLGLIQQAPEESFLLAAVIDLLCRFKEHKLIDVPHPLADFEMWINQAAGLSNDANERVRAKIVGKQLPRDDYQIYFPIGMGRRHIGSHFVTAHNPPDLDTAVASFWGWVDAFAARLSKGVHWWNLPGGAAPAQLERLFAQLFGPGLLSLVPRQEAELAVTALDLVRQKELEAHSADALTSEIDHGRYDKLVILIDDNGYYQGCWRSGDVENYRLASLLVRNAWRWWENHLTGGLMQLLAKPEVQRSEMEGIVVTLMETPLEEMEMVRELSPRHRQIFEATLIHIFGLEQGLGVTYRLWMAACQTERPEFGELTAQLGQLTAEPLFDTAGLFTADRTQLFGVLSQLQQGVAIALEAFRHDLDRLGTVMRIKHEVFGQSLHYVEPEAELAEIRRTIGPYQFLPVVRPTSEGKYILLGVIHASDLQRRILGTASLRDFCNREEMKIPDHIEVISIVDHHRSALQTTTAPAAVLGDVQSCNVLLAELAFAVNDRYGVQGLAGEPIETVAAESPRLALRLAQRALATATRGSYYVHPRREFAEYLCFLFAILDDTDLLSRVTARDVLCVASLINRMKSLVVGHEVECIRLDDLARGPSFPKQAARRILENREMYSLYGRIYALREQEVQVDLGRCVAGKQSAAFADTKEQKGCARVGQTKIFANNVPWLNQNVTQFRQAWLQKARTVYQGRPDLDLHIQMITTIPGAEEVYTGHTEGYSHQDEIWLWVPKTEEAHQRLASYLKSFSVAPEIAKLAISVTLLGSEPERLQEIFEHHFQQASLNIEKEVMPYSMAVIHFEAATVTSRKLSITPHIPALED